MARAATLLTQPFGVETTKGVAASRTRLFRHLKLDFKNNDTTSFFAAAGFQVSTTGVKQRSMTEVSYDGPFSYDESVVPFVTMFDRTVTQILTSGCYTWAFSPAQFGEDVYRTLTVEHGDGSNADLYTYVAASTLTLTLSTTDTSTISGNGFARPASNTGAPVTSSGLSFFSGRPISVSQIDVFYADTYAGLESGTGREKITGIIGTTTYEVAEKLSPTMVLDTDFPSFRDYTQKQHEVTLKFTAENNAANRAIKAALAAASRPVGYFRIRATGDVISATGGPSGAEIRETFTLDCSAKLVNTEFNNEGDVYGIVFDLEIVIPQTGQSHAITFVNRLASI